ncbi:unnamed protein product, partial [Penicillium bialowiezense]
MYTPSRAAAAEEAARTEFFSGVAVAAIAAWNRGAVRGRGAARGARGGERGRARGRGRGSGGRGGGGGGQRGGLGAVGGGDPDGSNPGANLDLADAPGPQAEEEKEN